MSAELRVWLGPGGAGALAQDVFVWKDFVDAATEAQLLASLEAVPRSRWQLLHGWEEWGGAQGLDTA